MSRLLLNPKVLWRFEVIPEDRDNFLNLVIRVRVNEEIRIFLSFRHSEFHLHLAASRHLLSTLGEALIFILRIKFVNHLLQLLGKLKDLLSV